MLHAHALTGPPSPPPGPAVTTPSFPNPALTPQHLEKSLVFLRRALLVVSLSVVIATLVIVVRD